MLLLAIKITSLGATGSLLSPSFERLNQAPLVEDVEELLEGTLILLLRLYGQQVRSMSKEELNCFLVLTRKIKQ